APRRSERARKERNFDPDFIDSQAIFFLVEGILFWKETIDDEMDSLVSNNTWENSNLPLGSKAIGCRWVFRIKYHTHGSIQAFNARVLFALALVSNLFIHQMDVKTAFLNGNLDEEVYMKQHERFVLPGHENKVCKLKNSLYGLKQAPKQWHDKFDKSIPSNGFTHNSYDICIYSKFMKDCGVIICLHVDDILIVRTNMEGINETKNSLSSCFQMKDMNEVDTILGIKVKSHSGGYALNRCHYIDKIIDKFQHLNIEEANTPYESSCKLVENDGIAIAQIKYASAIGYSDASWITGSSDSKSTTSWIFTLGGRTVCWGSKKQTCITHFTMEAEFLALVQQNLADPFKKGLPKDSLWNYKRDGFETH
nr:zinc finger, CCHC-type [Tanacetum cinerariifolium]